MFARLVAKKSTHSACLTEEERGRGFQSYFGGDFWKGASPKPANTTEVQWLNCEGGRQDVASFEVDGAQDDQDLSTI